MKQITRTRWAAGLALWATAGWLNSVNSFGAVELEEGFEPIFDGRSTTGWVGNPTFWSVKEGAITGQTTKEKPAPGNTFLVYKGGKFSDFVLRFSYRTTPNNDKGFANSGVQYRSRSIDVTNYTVIGYQADIEAGPTFSGILYDEGGGAGNRGVMAERGERVLWDKEGKKQVIGSVGKADALQAAIKQEGWNDYEIIAQGYHFVHKINGATMVDVTDETVGKRIPTGIIALQLHAGDPMTVQFKDIRLKRMEKKIVLVAGTASHGSGTHEHRAGCHLLRYCLEHMPGVRPVVVEGGWPKDTKVFANAAAIAIYSDGGDGHPFIQQDRLQVLKALMDKGVGLGLIHYAVEVPKDKGGSEFLAWAGGYFETYWSVNPTWEADFKTLPEHAVTRGVRPFRLLDEWYYHMRFPEGMKNVAPILTAVPPDGTRGKPGANDPHGGNPEVQKHMGEPEHLMWVTERPDGGRGFGITGGHWHKNWLQPDLRKAVLNALLWIAKVEVPADGLDVPIYEEILKLNVDAK